MKKTSLLFIVLWAVASFGLFAHPAFAGDPNCQSGYITNPYNSNPAPRRPGRERAEEKQLAAAKGLQARNQPPLGRDSGFSFSSMAAFAVPLVGLWLVFILLFRFRRKPFAAYKTSGGRLRKIAGFALNPSVAFSVFGFLFAATIIGSQLVAPTTKTTAQKRDKLNKLKMTGEFNPSNKPVFKSAQQIGGDESTQIGAPVFDAAGNRYVRGTFTRNLPIGSQTLQESKFFDMFFAKYAPDGTPLWARQGIGATTEISAPGVAVEGATALAVDDDGNIYVGGSFVKKMTLQGGANPNITLTDDGAAGVNYESFVAKYDTDGNLLWARGGNTGSPKNTENLEIGQNAISKIVLDQKGNPFITGFVSGTNFFGTTVVNSGKTDVILAKLDPANGAVVWQSTIGGERNENGLDLKIDAASNLYMIGTFASDEIIFPDGTKFGNLKSTDGIDEESTNTFIAKFDANGSTLWAQNLDNENTLGGSQIAVNAAGEIFMTGYFFDTAVFGDTVLYESEGTGDEESALGGYLVKMTTDGDFVWAEGFGGVGKAISLDPAGRIYVVGTFWDGGTFGGGTANEEYLASFAGVDLFVARYDSNGGFNWAKAITGSDAEGGIDIGNPSDEEDGTTDNNYNPLGIAYNPATGTMFLAGDFRGVLSLDCQTLQTPENARHSYLAELSADDETTSCRIWNGFDEDDNDWDSPDNWNGNVLPTNNDSVYVPYTGYDFDNPSYNPKGIGDILNNLTVADDRILTLERDLVITGKLWLTGGIIDAGDERLIDLTDTATANRIADAQGFGGYIIGKIRKEFGNTNPFTFPVGTANGYSPVDVVPQAGFGSLLAIKAVEQPQPFFADAPNRINRYWSIDRAGKGFIVANLTFHYLQTDVVGNESLLKLYKIEDSDPPEEQFASIDTEANTATVNGVSNFSDWTLANLAPSAALVSVGGRIMMPSGYGISDATLVLTDETGISRKTRSSSFGYFQFAEVEAGKTYVLSVQHRRYSFAAQVINVSNALNNLQIVSTK